MADMSGLAAVVCRGVAEWMRVVRAADPGDGTGARDASRRWAIADRYIRLAANLLNEQ